MPRALGVDISDASIKWLLLGKDGEHLRVVSFGDEPLSAGVVVQGLVQDIPALTKALMAIKAKWHGVECAHAALPEESAYVFSMHVPYNSGREQTLRLIEFELEGRVPIAPNIAVYDYNIIMDRDDDQGTEIGVVVFAREHAQSYVEAFHAAGIQLLSLEVEARSIARAVASDAPTEPITMLVDFGRDRSGFAVVKRGVPIFTSTVAVGGEAITAAVVKKLNLTAEQAVDFKDEEGLLADASKKEVVTAIMPAASALADEVAKHYHYWDTRRNEHGERMTPVGKVILVGGSSNLRGLEDFIAGKVQAEVERGNIWRHVSGFDDYIPPIDRRTSLQYATAMGLALRSMHLKIW